MEHFIGTLKTSNLFSEFQEQEIQAILKCLGAYTRTYQKEEAVWLAGDQIREVGIVLAGTVRIQREDFDGNLVIVEELGPGDMFGEAFVCAAIPFVPINVWTKTKAEIIFLDYSRIIATCSSACSFHTKLIKNMLKIFADKLIRLNQKNSILQKNSIREKLMAYFESCTAQAGERTFVIPFSRSALAEYLGVNRSAMSRELGNMKKDGLIDFDGNCFRIPRPVK